MFVKGTFCGCCGENMNPDLTIDFLSLPTQEESRPQPQVHMEEVCQFNQEMVVRN